MMMMLDGGYDKLVVCLWYTRDKERFHHQEEELELVPVDVDAVRSGC